MVSTSGYVYLPLSLIMPSAFNIPLAFLLLRISPKNVSSIPRMDGSDRNARGVYIHAGFYRDYPPYAKSD